MITSGGVCEVLDYEISQMTDYVVEMTQRLVWPSSSILPSLRKFVSDLLSSTRLPSTTILLGLHYLARRTNLCKSAGPLDVSETEIRLMLTIGLLLGSKFLDDNTFQNRSWSEVSGVPVANLNISETEWLIQMDYCIYVNLDENTDFIAWMASWEHWRNTKNIQRKSTLDRLAPLAPIDTSVHQYPQVYNNRQYKFSTPSSSVEPPPGFGNYRYDKSSWAYSAHQRTTPPNLTPPSASDSGISTPVYMNMGLRGTAPRYKDWSNLDSYQNHSYSRGFQHQMNASYHSTRVAAYNTPVYHGLDYQYSQNTWNHSPICIQPDCYACSEAHNLSGKIQHFFPSNNRHQIMAG
ncbi:hypothetical protein K3495_g4392 [Podosphaera aphanis]|nr:hypothetical protein K3495_g4392 [Podosphaera aphanis]